MTASPGQLVVMLYDGALRFLLQASTASDPAERPVLLWVDREAGHGQGKPLNLRLRDTVDSRLFLMWQLGM